MSGTTVKKQNQYGAGTRYILMMTCRQKTVTAERD